MRDKIFVESSERLIVSRESRRPLTGSPQCMRRRLWNRPPRASKPVIGTSESIRFATPSKERYGAPIGPADLESLGGDRRARLQGATTLIMRRIAALTGNEAREDVLARAGAAT